MLTYLAKRLAQSIPTLLGVSIVVFIIINLAPGDPVEQILGSDATQEQIDAMRRQLGLDQPLVVQYFYWLGDVLQGDLGQSLYTSRPVLEEILARLPNTIILAFAAMLIAVAIGIPLGILAAVKSGTALDHIAMVVAVSGWSMPAFWIGLLLIIVFSVGLGWLPTGGMYDIMSFENNISDLLVHLILPAFTLGLRHMAYVARFTRSSLLEVLNLDYIRTARAKGISEPLVIMRHALRNALIPIISVLGVTIGHLLGGAVVVEAVFTWPGLGSLMVQGIGARDYQLVQGCMLFVAAIFIAVSLLVDVLYSVIDPRIKY